MLFCSSGLEEYYIKPVLRLAIYSVGSDILLCGGVRIVVVEALFVPTGAVLLDVEGGKSQFNRDFRVCQTCCGLWIIFL